MISRLGGGRYHISRQAIILAHAVGEVVAAVGARASLVVGPERGVGAACGAGGEQAGKREVLWCTWEVLCAAPVPFWDSKLT